MGEIGDDRVTAERLKGRGAISNAVGRFETAERVGFEDGWDIPEAQLPIRTEYRIERPRKVVTRNQSPDLSFDRSINPYRGCEHGCIYCFARPNHEYLGLSAGVDFETKIVMRPGAAEKLARELSAKSYRPATIAIGTATDPYQPIEAEQKIMRGILQVLADFNHPVAIVTKGALIERDMDILAPMAAKGLARVGISVTTLDDRLSRLMEPRVPRPARRLQTIQALSDAGIEVRVMASPVIPGLCDHELERILDAGAKAGAVAASWIMLRLPFSVSKLFTEWLETHFPDRAQKVMARVREMHGGKAYDAQWFQRMRGEGEYAQMIAHRAKIAMRRLQLKERLPPLRTDLFAVPPRAGDQLSLF